MLFLLLCIQTAVPVLSEPRPAAPHNVHVDNQLLTWTPATEEGDVTYTVQYRSVISHISLGSDEWEDVPDCVHITLCSCNVTSAKAKGEHGCVMLRVQAERDGLTSRQVSACGRHGDSCTPEPTLTARPGSLTVHLSRKHRFAQEHMDSAKHMVYYGKEGESLKQTYTVAISSVSIHDLLEGQRYCVQVQYIYTSKPVGPASCTQCELIPESKPQTGIAVAVGSGIALLTLIPAIAYILIFQRGRIKAWLRPPYEIPEDFLLNPSPEHYNIVSISTPSDEQCDVISCINPKEFAD